MQINPPPAKKAKASGDAEGGGDGGKPKAPREKVWLLVSLFGPLGESRSFEVFPVLFFFYA